MDNHQQMSSNGNIWRQPFCNSNVRGYGTSRISAYRRAIKKQDLALSAKGSREITSFFPIISNDVTVDNSDDDDSMNGNLDTNDFLNNNDCRVKLKHRLSFQEAFEKLQNVIQSEKMLSRDITINSHIQRKLIYTVYTAQGRCETIVGYR